MIRQNELEVIRKEEKKERKIYCVRGCKSHARWAQGVATDNMEEADLVISPGGGDLDYHLYADTEHPAGWGYTPMAQDTELADLRKAISLKKPIFGVCKGGQYGCVLSGGILVQDISHPMSHNVTTIDNRELKVNSFHHQLCYPFNLPKSDYKLLAWAENISSRHQDGNMKEMDVPVEPELIYFPKTKFISAQFHPESMSENEPMLQYCRELIDNLLEDKL